MHKLTSSTPSDEKKTTESTVLKPGEWYLDRAFNEIGSGKKGQRTMPINIKAVIY